MGKEVADVDGNTEDRSDTVSVFNGPAPVIHEFGSEEEEIEAVSAWILELAEKGAGPVQRGL